MCTFMLGVKLVNSIFVNLGAHFYMSTVKKENEIMVFSFTGPIFIHFNSAAPR